MERKQLAPTSTWVQRWEVVSDDSGKTYIVSQKVDASWGCDCPRWKFAKAPKPDCKHILGIKDQEPIDYKKTSAKAAAEFTRTKGRIVLSEPVFLLQTKRQIRLVD